ncbi:MAG: IPT/TIG domain-containing protein [Actinobacteria bacterium]|nr:IPT/TIG domain-containing protein [Actinomycetota bacterium]MBU1943675.1 IPT/TIG domain-containing protein [Actinomycetota bacterium]MBU2686181.1 IPT/TIG domain-containing protein [Actinomycetota bacterium]
MGSISVMFRRGRKAIAAVVFGVLLAALFVSLGAVVPTGRSEAGAADNVNHGDLSSIQEKVWYLAEGYTGGGFDTWVLVQNPSDEAASVTMEFQLPGGTYAQPFSLTVPANTRQSVHLDEIAGLADTEVSTRVTSDRGVFVERSIYFDYAGIRGGTSTVGCVCPDFNWLFAEGYTGSAFDTYVLVQNPGDTVALVTMDFQLPPGATAEPHTFEVPPGARRTVKLDDLPGLGSTDVSTKVSSTQPVVAERAMYFDYYGNDGGHCSLGATSTDQQFYMPEGYTGGSFDTYLLVQNPGEEEAEVVVEFQLPDGLYGDRVTFNLPAGTRQTLKVDDVNNLASTDISTIVYTDVPAVVERAMYFDSEGHDGGSCSQASDSVSDTWHVPEGCTREGFDTWILLQNPTDETVHAALEFQLAPGYSYPPYELDVPARGRRTVHLNELEGFPAIDVSTTVRSDLPLVVESSMYFDYEGRKGGHSSLGHIPNMLTPEGVILDEVTASHVTSAPDGKVVFAGTTGLLQNIEAGRVICSGASQGAPNGFLRKVTEVQRVGSVTTLITEQASVVELIRYGNFYGTSETPVPAGGVNVNVPFDIDLLGKGELKGDVDLTIGLDISIHIKWKWKVIPVGFTFSICASVGEKVSLELKANADFSLTQEVKIKTFYLDPIDAGPLVFFPKINIFVGFDGSVAGGTDLSCSETLSASVGFGYDGWYTIHDFDAGATADASIPYKPMDNKTYVKEEIECLLYDVVGPYIDVLEYIRLHSDPNEDPWWNLYLGVQSDGGVDINLVVWHLKWHGEIYDHEWLIKSAPAKPAITSISPDPSFTGSQVTISGAHFGGSKAGSWYVDFGGVHAQDYAQWTDGAIVCTVPAGLSGIVPVTVWNDGGLSPPHDFHVQPHITGLSPGSGTVGTQVTVDGSAFGASRGGSSVSFGGTRVTQYDSWTDGRIVCRVPAGAWGKAQVTVDTTGGTSNSVEFDVAPHIDSVDPTSGIVGTQVTIDGSAFGGSRGASLVSFGGTTVTGYVSWSDTQIVCGVPLGASGQVQVTVTTEGGTSNGVTFKVVPQIDSLSPTAGMVGTEVTISGSAFGGSQGGSYVSFGDTRASSYVVWSDTQVVCHVPLGASGKTRVTVTTPGGTSNGADFSVVPYLSEIDPISGIVGTQVTLSGTAFGDARGSSYVSFGGTRATSYQSWSDIVVVCKVPLGASGNVQVSLTTGGGTSNAFGFAVVPDITDLDPAEGIVGTQVTVNGSAFGGSRGASVVSFGGTAVAEYVSWSDTQVVCRVPQGVSGQVQVTVTTEGGTSSGITFDVVPDIDSIDPTSGIVGTQVTVNGTAFGAAQDGSIVRFDGVQVTDYVSWSDTLVVCQVPLGASGIASVTLTTAGGTSNGVDFSVIPHVDSIEPAAAPVGTQVTLDGSAFGASQGDSFVSFGDTKVADYQSWSDTRIVCTVPDSVFGKVSVSVTTEGGTSNQTPFDVSPHIANLNPKNGGMLTAITITGSAFGPRKSGSAVLFGTTEAAGYTQWTDSTIRCVVPEGPTAGTVSVVTDGGQSNGMEFTVLTPDWYLAEGTTAWGFDSYLSIENPNDDKVDVTVTYMLPQGEAPTQELTLPAHSQTTVNPEDYLEFETDFSTRVQCSEGKMIAVDRTMQWTGTGAPSPDGHCSIGVVAPAKTWFLPEGSSNWGFETWLLIQNPNDREAVCEVTYMPEGGEARTFFKKIPAFSRRSYSMAEDMGAVDASIRVNCELPVIPERSMYRNSRREGHCSIGTTLPAHGYYLAMAGRGLSHDCYLAEGSTDWGFTTYLLVQNPNDDPASVDVTYMLADGAMPQEVFVMPPRSRKTIKVNDVLPNRDFAIHVHGSIPVAAERSMYWGGGTALGEATHDTIGMTDIHNTFFFPDGEVSDGRETFTCLMNPNQSPVVVEVSYLGSDGKVLASFLDTLMPLTRQTYDMADRLVVGRASVLVRVTTPGMRIMAERAMYWNNRGAGTCTIGGFEDREP